MSMVKVLFCVNVFVQVVEETSGTIKPVHRQGMMEALGNMQLETHVQRLDTAPFAALPRDRYWLSTLPAQVPPLRPFRRPPPWDPDWGQRWGVGLGPQPDT